MIIQSQLLLSCSEGEWNPAWQELGHPAPAYVNDRASKAFELFIPELDKEVDMASDLARAMCGTRPGETAPEAEAHEALGTPTRQQPSRHPAGSHQATAEVTGEVTGEVRRLVAACGHP